MARKFFTGARWTKAGWPDGLLTPPSDAAMRFDVDFLKAAGFNMIRKHIKVSRAVTTLTAIAWHVAVAGSSQRGQRQAARRQEISPKWTRLAPNPTDAEWTDDDHAQWLKSSRR